MPGDQETPQVQSWHLGSVRVLRLMGELDALTVPDVEVRLDEALLTFEEPLVVADLTRVTFIASAGVATMVRMRQRVQRRQGRLVVVLPPDGRARRLFELTRMVDHFEVRTTLPEAVDALRAHAPSVAVHEKEKPAPAPTSPAPIRS